MEKSIREKIVKYVWVYSMTFQNLCRRGRFEAKLNRKSKISFKEAQDILNACHFKAAPCFAQNNCITKDYDLMIVIPVYNVEQYLEECLDSVFSQKTQYRFSVVAVDDGSTDNSGAILDQYASYENLTIIHQKNAGLSGARNTALKKINANYVLFLDSDDYLSENAVELLLTTAYEYDADIVQGAHNEFKENGDAWEVRHKEETCRISIDEITGFACIKLIRGDLLKNFCFPEGFLYEDTVMSKILYPVCQTAVSIPDVVYYYRQHTNSITGSAQKLRNIETYWITKYCLEEAARRNYKLDAPTYALYLQQCWVNYIRTRYLPKNIQESIFVLTHELLGKHFPNQPVPKPHRLRMLHRAFRANSFKAYRFVLDRWDIL